MRKTNGPFSDWWPGPGAVRIWLINEFLVVPINSLALPADGTYLIVVSQQDEDDLLPGNPFSGDYCLTVDADAGAAQTLTPLSSVE